MKKLVLVLMMAFALVSVNATQKVATVVAKVDTAVVAANADTTAIAESVDASDGSEMNELAQAIQESGTDVVGFAAIVSPFIAGFLIVLIVLIFNHRNKKAKYELMAKAIDAGKELPAAFFDEPRARKTNKTPLQSAFSLMGVGIGLFLMFWFLKGELTLAFIGAIPFMIGLGKFIAYRLEQKSPNANDDDQQIG